MTAIERCKWTNIDEQIDEGAAAVACDEPAIGQSCVFNGPACAKRKCRCTPKAPPPPTATVVEACDGPFCAVCGAREPHLLDVCLNVLRQRLTAEQAELRAAREAIAQLEEDRDHAKVDASQWKTSTNQHAASHATLLAIADAAEALSNGLSAYDGAQPEDAVHIYDRNEEALATLRARLAERGK